MSWRGSVMSSSSQTVLGRVSVSGGVVSQMSRPSRVQRPGPVLGSDAAEAVDRLEVLLALLGIADAEALLGSQRQDADLALVGVAVHVERGLPDLGHRVDLGQRRMDQALVDE